MEDTQFLDAEQWSGGNKDKLTFNIIVLEFLKHLGKLFSTEFRGGYYKELDTKDGVKEVYVPDTRETLCNAIEYLYSILYPHFNEVMATASDAYQRATKENIKIFLELSSPDEDIVLADVFYDNEKDRMHLETYKQKNLAIHRTLFLHLSIFLKSNKYGRKTSTADIIQNEVDNNNNKTEIR